MANPQMPQMPGAAVVTDTLDFVKNLWGSMGVPGLGMPGMGVPGITAPTLSVEELDKKINDLKAVEAWLNLNTSMLRGSIQALEVQRGTIATLQSMGANMAAAMTQPGASDKSLFDSVPYASAFFQQPATAKPPAPAPETKTEAKPAPAPQAASTSSAGDAAAQAAAQLANPSVWWNLLQDQFKQAVSSAMAAEPAASTKPAPGTAPAGKQDREQASGHDSKASTAAPAKARAPAKRAAPRAKPAGKA